MSFYQPNNGNGMGGSPSYNSSTSGPPSRKSGKTLQVMVNLAANQYVEVRLSADSPWTVVLVLAVIKVVEKTFGLQYEIRYQADNRVATSTFAADDIRVR